MSQAEAQRYPGSQTWVLETTHGYYPLGTWGFAANLGAETDPALRKLLWWREKSPGVYRLYNNQTGETVEDNRAFECAMCNGVFIKNWSEEEAEAERQRDFGASKKEDCDEVCDVCYQQMRPDQNPEAYEAYMESTDLTSEDLQQVADRAQADGVMPELCDAIRRVADRRAKRGLT